ncbi:hypothetical protein GH714_026758 [Hevea brasiliensis]|uniref:R3H domain-containing protein n=1 Tax=Hevea brasiliensis TaxID=3981 RepID=A0A6A6M120_HEVBR|nr:hypothetical protein GH714_026758 [Hevea brasiliensis]
MGFQCRWDPRVGANGSVQSPSPASPCRYIWGYKRNTVLFGARFAHVSVGEGDERHLVLERCSETSIPSILVSDILFQYEESQPLTRSHQLLRRNNAPPEMKEPQKQKPRSVPVVARRMIAHALGQKISPWNQDASVKNCKGHEVQTTELNVPDKNKIDPNSGLEGLKEASVQPVKNIDPLRKAKSNNHDCNASSPAQRNLPHEPFGRSSTNGSSRNRVKEYSKEEHLGAAKRMFANALGLQSTKGGLARCTAAKQVDLE